MKKIILTFVILQILKSWAFAYDFKTFDSYGNELAYRIINDSSCYIVNDREIQPSSWSNSTENYVSITCDTLRIPAEIQNGSNTYKVIGIGEYALACTRIKHLIIPNSIKVIEKHSLGYYNDIEEYIVDSNNIYFESLDGVLLSKNHKQFIQYPPSKKNSLYMIPNGVEEIKDNSCVCIRNLQILETPLSLKKVGPLSFVSESIREIIFQDSLRDVDYLAFAVLPNLQKLVFGNNVKNLNIGVLAYYRPLILECRTLIPPPIILSSFQHNDSSILYVPRSSVSAYQQAEGWNQFGTILPIEPPIVAGTDNATVSWVQNFSATGYVWHLYSDEEHTQLVMSLVFDERGYLTELILGDVMPASAAMRGMDISEVNDEDNGSERRFAEYYSFTIRSLTPDRQYYFVRQSLAGDEVIDEEQGSFETLPDTETGLNNGNTTTDLTPTTATKRLQDGQLLIVAPDGSIYTPDGKILKEQRPLRSKIKDVVRFR